ncbi:MAG: SUMF1/EgtB/PvdO family nonheme iron enzyme [Anaerolineaceae bacterium]|nr:SUMF1/EgtB/PvdO family nonheme iron enzyme [Anaerolineaceae bacterium]
MAKLFISYRSLDSSKVDTIVSRLRSLKSANNTNLFEVWQDKSNIPDGQDWWESIVDAIIDCNIFLFMVSHESFKNHNCRAELAYARKRNRPILPIVLEGEYFYNPKTGKNDIDYWDDIPQELDDLRAQFLFYEGTSFFQKLEEATSIFISDPQRWSDLPAERPRDPRSSDEDNSVISLYDEACDYAWRVEFGTAERFFQKLINLNDHSFRGEAREWISLLREYQTLLSLATGRNTRHKLKLQWENYKRLFPKSFIEGIFDPKDIQSLLKETSVVVASSPTPEKTEIQSSVLTVISDKPAGESIYNILPQPFEWVEIPEGKIPAPETQTKTRGKKDKSENIIKRFSITRYPITNAQFQVFIDEGGYDIREYWIEEGWVYREEKKWSKPLDWRKGSKLNHPVVGISWFEAKAFCSWLSKLDGDNVDLPSEWQWQRAAQGNTEQKYPWGNLFISTYCNHGNTSSGHRRKATTTQVQTYSTKADSPFGVADMIGNVWEWCLDVGKGLSGSRYGSSMYYDERPDPEYHSLRGGSWRTPSNNLAIYFHSSEISISRKNDLGFRIVRG